MTDDQLLDALRALYPDINRWQLRAGTVPPEEPERHSQLAGDDARFPPHRVSEIARMSLVLAGEHLRLARDAIEAGQLYASAHFTVLRGAFVGSAQAVWVLCPEDTLTRVDRGLTVVAEMYTQLKKFDDEQETTS